MPLYHFAKYTYGRHQSPKSAAVYCRYILRESWRTIDRNDLLYAETRNIPAWANGNSVAFFAAAEQYERTNGRIADSWEMSLPRELSLPQRHALIHDFLTVQRGDSKPLVWAIHEPLARDGEPQPHVHILMSPRMQDAHERSATAFFRCWNAAEPAQGGCQKDWSRGRTSAYSVQRAAWADVLNWHLERAGIDAAVDPRSLAERGFTRAPQQHRGTALDREESDTARAARLADQALEAAHAHDYWTQRKVTLGLTAEMSHEHAVQRIATHFYGETQAPRLTREALHAQRDTVLVTLAEIRHDIARLDGELMQEAHHERTGTPRSPASRRRVEALLNEAVTIAHEDVPQRGVSFTFRRDRERDRDVGRNY